jgi:nitrogen regulatory protein P-II 1
MKKIEAVIRPHLLGNVKDALQALGVQGLTFSEVKGIGRQTGRVEFYRGCEYIVDTVPKVKIEVVLDDDILEYAVEVILKVARTWKIGDGKIFVLPVDEAFRILTGESGVDAIY